MKNRYILILSLSTLFSTIVKGQSDSLLLSKSEAYQKSPKEYLKKLNSEFIPGGILIDRHSQPEEILKLNGLDKVKSIDYAGFKKTYKALRNASSDTNLLPYLKKIEEETSINNGLANNYNITILNLISGSILPEALEQNKFKEQNNQLEEIVPAKSNYRKHRVFACSMLSNQLVGDNIRFTINHDHYFNNTQEELNQIQINFGNGEGFKDIQFGNPVDVDYSGPSNYVEIILKLTVTKNGSIQTLYAHHTIYRKSITHLSRLSHNRSNLKSSDLNQLSIYNYNYPNNDEEVSQLCNYLHTDFYELCYNYETTEIKNKIEYSIIYNSCNTEWELKKPFIIVDGFDPGDNRDVIKNNVSSDALRYDRDYRGILELLDGQKSPWDTRTTSTNFIDSLRARGYDIVVVNFKDGAGSVMKNSGLFSGFLHNILNGRKYRTNNTEEMVVVGPSMGGLITRIAIRCLELNSTEHYVKQWISFDSPHKGATIPIGLQHALSYGEGMIDNSFADGLAKLNSKAAEQMLLHHFQKTNWKAFPHNEFNQLQEFLNTIGYPVKCQRVAISNGGRTRLYPSRSKIIDFKSVINHRLQAWDNWNSGGKAIVFEGKVPLSKKEYYDLDHQMAIEKAVGGWVPATYSINYVSQNKINHSNALQNIPKTRSCFIPASSAFGIKPSRDNLFYPVTKYAANDNSDITKITTPFDGILGMQENEEHVRLTPSTRDYVLNHWLDPATTSTIRPFVRSGSENNSIINKPVAFVLKDSITFSKRKNYFKAVIGADIKVKSGNNITFKPGTSIDKGAKLCAQISEDNTICTSNKKEDVAAEVNQKAYLQENPYKGILHDYSEEQTVKDPINSNKLNADVYPNPSNGTFNLKMEKPERHSVSVKVFSMTGQLMYHQNVTSNDVSIDGSNWNSGIYFIEVNGKNNTETLKVSKI